MVCKEDFFIWFKSLKGSKRIEVMCGLLNMCCPLELRFCGTCLEELASHNFFALKEDEARANNVQELLKLKNVQESHTRSRLIVYLSLLHGSNSTCSNSIFKLITDEIKVNTLVQAGVLSDPKFVDELLLLLSMAANHPAFSYDQQTFIQDLCDTIESYSRHLVRDEVIQEEGGLNNLLPTMSLMSPVLISDHHVCNTPMCHQHSDYDLRSPPTNVMENSPSQNHITTLKVKPSNKKMCVKIRVTLASGKVVDAIKSPYDITLFHQKLVQQYPHEAYSPNREKYIPHLPEIISTCSKQEVVNENLFAALSDYISLLNNRLPSRIMQSEYVLNFFLSSSGHTRAGLTRNPRSADDFTKNRRIPQTITIYNSSRISDGSPTKRIDNRPRSSPPNSLQRKAPENGNGLPSDQSAIFSVNSPLHSPLNSPYISPVNSETNSRSASPWIHRFINDHSSNVIAADTFTFEKLLIKEQLHEYWDILRHYRIEELQSMQLEDLEFLGITKDAAVKLRKLLDTFRSFLLPPNGLDNAGNVCRNPILNVPLSMKNNGPLHEESNESSPTDSDPCSPPQSPSPSEIGNHTSSSNSSSEEIIEKGTPSKTKGKLSEIEESVELQDSCSEETFVKNIRETSGWSSIPSLVPMPMGYAPTVPQMSPIQHHKPSFVPLQCRTNAGLHISPGRVIFDNKQFTRVPLPSALTFMPHMSTTRSHENTMTPPSSSGVTFPVVTSGSATVPSPTCSFATNKSANVTVVTNSSTNRQPLQKGSTQSHDNEPPKVSLLPQGVENLYSPTCTYLLTDSSGRPNIVSTCTCICTGNVHRPSPAPSPSLSPASSPQQPSASLPASLPLYGLPYVFHHTLPFLPNHSGAPTNGFIQPSALPTIGQGFTYALPNGMSALSPELIYGTQTFVPQSVSPSQTMPAPPSAASHCYANYQLSANPSTLNPGKPPSCYNCGKSGHRGTECKEQNIDEISKARFQLHYAFTQKSADNSD